MSEAARKRSARVEVGPKLKPAPVPSKNARGERTDPPKAMRAWVIARDRGRCKRCGWLDGQEVNRLEVNHIHEVCEGGMHDPDNLDTLCHECHREWTMGILGDGTYAEWIETPAPRFFVKLMIDAERDDDAGQRLRAQLATITAAQLIDIFKLERRRALVVGA